MTTERPQMQHLVLAIRHLFLAIRHLFFAIRHLFSSIRHLCLGFAAGQPHSSACSPWRGKTARRVAAIDLSSQPAGSYPRLQSR
jgi:hypothetical protein